MKILFYTPVSLQNGGGCEIWHCDIAESLSHTFSHEVTIVSANLSEEKKWSPEYLAKRLNGLPYKLLNYKILFNVLVPTPDVILALYKEIKKSDVVHFTYGFMGQDILMLILSLFAKKRIIVGHHAPIFHTSRIHNLYMKLISRHVAHGFSAHYTLNKSDLKVLHTKWRIKNVFYIPCGVQISRFKNLHKPVAELRLRFLTVGRYEEQKGYDLLLNAIEKFNSIHNDDKAEFTFVGSGSLSPLIDTYSKRYSNIHNLGYVLNEKIPEIYSENDIYILSSRYEPFGLVLVEAWASGMPVLATRTEGPLDMVHVNHNGWFIDQMTIDGICNGIANVYNIWKSTPSILKDMQKNCYTTAECYSIDNMGKKLSSLLTNGKI